MIVLFSKKTVSVVVLGQLAVKKMEYVSVREVLEEYPVTSVCLDGQT